MRLTKNDKEAFIKAVIDDVPVVDYDEQAWKLIKDFAIELMPPSVRQAYAEAPEYFENNYVHTPGGLRGVFVPILDRNNVEKKNPALWSELTRLGNLADDQDRVIDDLRTKVRAMIEGCGTLKTAQERLPEFIKYLPADRDGTGTTNLPVANTVADLMNAGWPKGKK